MEKKTQEGKSDDKDLIKENLKTQTEEVTEEEVEEAVCRMNPDKNLRDRG